MKAVIKVLCAVAAGVLIFTSPSLCAPSKPSTHTPAGSSAAQGQIIGNKRTHVYHLPGDKGRLPKPENRVYFKTAAQAEAAGYRLARHGKHKHAGAKSKSPASKKKAA